MGQVYVEVTGEVANGGIMTMAESGGDVGGTYRLNWTASGGFTGTGWETAWGSSNVPLNNAWTNSPVEGFEGTYDGFISYVNSGIDDLTLWLDGAGWTNEQKYEFAHNENPIIWMNCVSPS